MTRQITPGTAVLAVVTVLAIGGSHLFDGPTEEQIALATAASLADAQQQARVEAALLKRCHKQRGPSVELVQVGNQYECREADIEPTPPEILRRYALLGGAK